MSNFVGVLVSDPGLQSQFTQVELRSLKSRVSTSPSPSSQFLLSKSYTDSDIVVSSSLLLNIVCVAQESTW